MNQTSDQLLPDISAALKSEAKTDGPRRVMVTRVPVFEGNSRVWGYDLLLNHADDSQTETLAAQTPAAQAAALSTAFALVTPFMRAEEKLILPLPEALFIDHSAFMFPQAFCCLNFTGKLTDLPALDKALTELRDAGYTLAVSCSRKTPELTKILPLARIARVNIAEFSPTELKSVADYLKTGRLELLAENVTPDKVKLCLDLGFKFLQGDVQTYGDVVKGKRFSASEIIKAKLLEALADPDWSVKDVAELIRVDVSLSYRLLRYLNSAYFSLPSAVSSIESCIVLLGRLGIEQWVYVTILSDLGVGPLAKHTINTAAFRGKFLEILGDAAGQGSPPRETLFMLGLFSMLESLLNRPLEEIAKDIKIDQDITSTLLGRENALQPWFSLLLKYERGEWADVRELGSRLNLSLQELSSAYTRAMTWVNTLFGPETAKAD